MAIRRVSPEVALELAKSGLPAEAMAFMAALSSGEISSRQGFRTQYGGTEWVGSLDTFPDWEGVPLSGGRHTTATGAWQDVKTTWNGEVVPAYPGITFQPQDQIKGNWWLAQRDYKVHSGGGDLLTALKAGELEQVSTALFSTWPGGAASPGFSDTYHAILTAPPIPTPPPTEMPSVSLSPGSTALLVSLVGYGRGNEIQPLPGTGGVLTVDDGTICDAVINPGGQGITITEKASGTTQIHFSIVVDKMSLTADLEVIVMALVRIAFVPEGHRPLLPDSGPVG